MQNGFIKVAIKRIDMLTISDNTISDTLLSVKKSVFQCRDQRPNQDEWNKEERENQNVCFCKAPTTIPILVIVASRLNPCKQNPKHEDNENQTQK